MSHKIRIEFKDDGWHYVYNSGKGKSSKGKANSLPRIMSALNQAILANENQDYRIVNLEPGVLKLHQGGKK